MFSSRVKFFKAEEDKKRSLFSTNAYPALQQPSLVTKFAKQFLIFPVTARGPELQDRRVRPGVRVLGNARSGARTEGGLAYIHSEPWVFPPPDSADGGKHCLGSSFERHQDHPFLSPSIPPRSFGLPTMQNTLLK